MLYNHQRLRDELKEWCVSHRMNNMFGDDRLKCRNFFHHHDNGLKGLPLDKNFLFYYNYHYLIAQQSMIKRYWNSLPEELLKDESYVQKHQDRIDILKKIMFADMKVACVPVVAAAWFTIDQWRWQDEDLQNLSYGLVLQYPELLVFGAYLTGLGGREILKRELTEKELSDIKTWAEEGVTDTLNVASSTPFKGISTKKEEIFWPDDFDDLMR